MLYTDLKGADNMKLKTKIKNENDMLGLLIKRMDENNEVDNNKLANDTSIEFDKYSMKILMKELNRRGYIIYTMDTTTLTKLGINNYISIWDRAFSWCITLIKFIVSYALGVFSGVLIAIIIYKLGIN